MILCRIEANDQADCLSLGHNWWATALWPPNFMLFSSNRTSECQNTLQSLRLFHFARQRLGGQLQSKKERTQKAPEYCASAWE